MKHIILLATISFALSGCSILGNFAINEQDEVATDRPPELYLVQNDTIALNLGTYCWSNNDMGLCADMMMPVYEENAHIQIDDDNLSLSFDGIAPTSLSVYVHPGSNLMTRIADIQLSNSLNDDGVVTIPLLEQLEGNYVLVVTAVWQDNPSGDAMYTLPITLE